ncbi:MFS transporter [Brachybacterium sp. AOP25-B2-12]|uniref:MFS transporter n=1 Tax=Brachybacterium sp. AOP25-B2-12 TaxID=3457710 RepID=UPI004034DBEB
MPKALYALALGGFGIGLTEFVIAGLLPEVAADLGVTEQLAGGLISGYALAVAVGAIALTAALGRIDRKRALLGLMVLFIVGNLVSALAPTYGLMLLGRILAALCHGAFFGIGAVVAADLVPPARRAAAIALMFTGLTSANVLGVPLGTFLGQAAGWRSTFWAISGIGVLALLGIAVLTPRVAAPERTGSLLGEFRVFARPQVWLSAVVTVLGIGLFAGNLLGGRAADRDLPRTLIVVLAALTVVLAAFALLVGNQVAAVAGLLLMGAFGFATVPGLQMRILAHAQEAPTLGSGANIAAFNIGNALGAWLGGLAIAAGLGYASPLAVGSAVTALALIVLVVATRVRGGEYARRAVAAQEPEMAGAR